MKNLEGMIKDKIEEVLVLMEANRDDITCGGTVYELDDGSQIRITKEWYSSSYNC